MKKITVLIPTYNRITALAVTLTSLCAQQFSDFDIIISDQSEDCDPFSDKTVQSILRVLESHGHAMRLCKNIPNQGIAQQREFLLQQSISPYSLFLDDDLILEPFVLQHMIAAIVDEHCGFVGEAVIGLSYGEDVRQNEQKIEFWNGRVTPEKISPEDITWQRYRLHNGANLWHVQKKIQIPPFKHKKYKIAWIGGCVLYDTEKLRSVGGFSFWKHVPPMHCGEDAYVQLKMMERFGGCGLLPSGVYHQELPTTLPDRSYNIPEKVL